MVDDTGIKQVSFSFFYPYHRQPYLNQLMHRKALCNKIQLRFKIRNIQPLIVFALGELIFYLLSKIFSDSLLLRLFILKLF